MTLSHVQATVSVSSHIFLCHVLWKFIALVNLFIGDLIPGRKHLVPSIGPFVLDFEIHVVDLLLFRVGRKVLPDGHRLLACVHVLLKVPRTIL